MRYIFLILALLVTVPVRAQVDGVLDIRAKTAPTFQTPTELVTYLTKGLTDDRSKARVLAAWVAYQVQRNGYRRKELIRYSHQNRVAPSPVKNDVFYTRVGTPRDFAELFQTLGQIAGLNVQVISGYAGRNIEAFRYQKPIYQAAEVLLDQWGTNNYLQRYEAAWNAVQSDGEWHLLDTYWMIANEDLFVAQNLSSDREMERFLSQRTRHIPARASLTQGKVMDNRYFYAKPNFFIRTHFPSDPEWQLLPTPWTWSTFISQ